MATLHLSIVTPDKPIFDDQVDAVVLPAHDGEMEVLPQHTALVTQIVAGELRYTTGGSEKALAVGAGFVEITNTYVKVLTDLATEADHIDEAAAEAARKRAEDAIAQGKLEGEDLEAEQALLAQASAQLALKRKRK
ncbi:ATP synthase F1 subunit epsilon [Verrucomicrobia bacterium LW23]|nr:ATP synthase F1 subunit epsilon [Verrucomicrobia bacterium LW23]